MRLAGTRGSQGRQKKGPAYAGNSPLRYGRASALQQPHLVGKGSYGVRARLPVAAAVVGKVS